MSELRQRIIDHFIPGELPHITLVVYNEELHITATKNRLNMIFGMIYTWEGIYSVNYFPFDDIYGMLIIQRKG